MTETIILHHIMEYSTVNGPGNRFVIWTQGCLFHCDGCFNQPTHSPIGGFNIDIAQLAEQINQTQNIRGITLTGGEPLLQIKQVSSLLNLIHKDLDVLLFSGYTLEEINANTIKNKFYIKLMRHCWADTTKIFLIHFMVKSWFSMAIV